MRSLRSSFTTPTPTWSGRTQVDFAARHFRPDPSQESRGIAELAAFSKAFRKYVTALAGRRDALARPLVWLGLDDARRVLQVAPDSIESWKDQGQLQLFREPPAPNSPRFRAMFDPVFDLSIVRATYALRRALELAPNDTVSLVTLKMAYDVRLMHEAVLPILDRLERVLTITRQRKLLQAGVAIDPGPVPEKVGLRPATQLGES